MPASKIDRAIRFLYDQVIKTSHRPSRLFTSPLYRLLVAVPISRRVVLFVLALLPSVLTKRSSVQSLCFVTANQLLFREQPEEAWLWFQWCLRLGPTPTDQYLQAALCLFQGMGRFGDAMSLFVRANEQGIAEAKRLGVVNTRYRVLDRVWARHIGHTATVDYVIKLGILEGRAKDDTILYVPPGSPIANRFLLDQVATQLRLVENALDLPFDASVLQALHYDYLGPCLPDRTTVYFWEIAAKTYKRWEREGRGALLSLPPDIEARGWTALHSEGVPKGAWFVALHVREGKWDGRDPGLHRVMNANISTYLPAMTEITRRGGWIIRMGDPSMSRLPPLANVIDYCHSGLRADWMDIFLAASCRFMIGTTSGPAFIPPLYGPPLLLSNWWPPAQRPFHASDIFVPKLLRSLTDGRYLTLSESLHEPFSHCHSLTYLADREKVYVDDCDPMVLAGAVKEMLALSEGDTSYGADVADLRARADKIYQAQGIFGAGQFAAEFLRRHASVIA